MSLSSYSIDLNWNRHVNECTNVIKISSMEFGFQLNYLISLWFSFLIAISCIAQQTSLVRISSKSLETEFLICLYFFLFFFTFLYHLWKVGRSIKVYYGCTSFFNFNFDRNFKIRFLFSCQMKLDDAAEDNQHDHVYTCRKKKHSSELIFPLWVCLSQWNTLGFAKLLVTKSICFFFPLSVMAFTYGILFSQWIPHLISLFSLMEEK